MQLAFTLLVSQFSLNEFIGLKLYKIWSKNYIIQKILFIGFGYILFQILGPTGIILGLGLSFIPFFSRLIIHSKQNFSLIPRITKPSMLLPEFFSRLKY